MADEEPCYLGALPPELILVIFEELDSVRDLGNFIITSRFLHQVFEGRRRLILLRILQNELGPALIDAKFLRLFPYVAHPDSPEGRKANRHRICTGAAMYKDMLNNSRHGRGGAIPNITELAELYRTFHRMDFLAHTYISVQNDVFGGEGASVGPPSRVERQRVLQALYRRQIICNASAPTREPEGRDQDTAARYNTGNREQTHFRFFDTFEPWEMQQVDHIDFFVAKLCSAFRFVDEEELKAAPAESERSSSLLPEKPISDAEVDDIFWNADRLVQYTKEHPRLTDAVLHSLVSLLPSGSRIIRSATPARDELAQRYYRGPLYGSWDALWLAWFQDSAGNGSGQRQEGGGSSTATVDFVGDAVDLPPFGWVDALDRRRLLWFGEWLDYRTESAVLYQGDTPGARSDRLGLWRAAGFAFWDKRRVETMKEQDRMKNLCTGWVVN